MCQIDKKSLIDLGILPGVAGNWALGSLLDHTHSPRARQALLDLLAQPLASRADILARQGLLRALPALAQHIDWSTFGQLSRSVESYLNSSYIVYPASSVEATVFTVRYGEIVQFIEHQLQLFSEFIATAVLIRHRLSTLQADSQFQLVVNAFDAVLDRPLVDELRRAALRKHQRRHALCSLDHSVRVELRAALLALIAAVHQFDAYCSLAITAQKSGLAMPQIVDKLNGPLAIYGLHHPLLPNGTANNIVQGTDRLMFLTGPNMAGKSTLLRALGIAIVFAHLGLPVPASSAAIPLTDRVVASLGHTDNILRAESLYLAEVRRVKSIAQAVASGEAVVALMDEVFRGTNVKDAADATTSLVNGLSHAKSGLFAISSHLIEVAESRGAMPGVGYWCLETLSADGQHTFTYRLVPGISTVRLGMELLASEGVLRLLDKISRQSLTVS